MTYHPPKAAPPLVTDWSKPDRQERSAFLLLLLAGIVAVIVAVSNA